MPDASLRPIHSLSISLALVAGAATVFTHAATSTNLALQWYVATVGDVPDRGVEIELPDRVTVAEQSTGCYHFEEQSSEWTRDGEEYVCGDRRLPRARMRAVLDTIVDARTQVPELIDEFGVTQAELDAHRDDVWRACLDREWLEAVGAAPPIPQEVERLLELERVAPAIRRFALHEMSGSTSQLGLTVRFHSSPEVMVHSSVSDIDGDAPGMLPWSVTIGARRWKSCDLAIPKAVLELADPHGRLTARLDDPGWWRDAFWRDSFWYGALAEQLMIDVGAHDVVEAWQREWTDSPFVLDSSKSWKYVCFDPLGVVFVLHAKEPGPIEVVEWCAPIRDGRLTGTKEELLRVWRDAQAAVARRGWLLDWKRAEKYPRELHLVAHGDRGHRSRASEPLVEPAWRDAGLVREPEFRLRGKPLYSGDVADFRLPTDSDATIVLSLESPPDFTFVDASGREEVRTLRK